MRQRGSEDHGSCCSGCLDPGLAQLTRRATSPGAKQSCLPITVLPTEKLTVSGSCKRVLQTGHRDATGRVRLQDPVPAASCTADDADSSSSLSVWLCRDETRGEDHE